MDELLKRAAETMFDASVDALLLLYPPEELKRRLDARAVAKANELADQAERLKFGEP